MSRPPTWLITGTSSGLGLSLSQLILKRGHNLISVSRHQEPHASLITLAKSYDPTTTSSTNKNSSPSPTGTLHHIPLDLSHPSQTNLSQTITHFLTSNPHLLIDILINNAGVTTFSPVETTSPSTLSHIMTTNFFSPVYLIQAVLPFMRRDLNSGSGTANKVIVNVSSTQGLCTDPSEGGYDASKHALEALSGVLAAEVGTFGIRVLIINLGSLRTGFARGGERSGLSAAQEDRKQENEKDGEEKKNEGGEDNPYTQPTHPVAKRISNVQKLSDVPGLARGDPEKTAAVIFDGVMRTPDTMVNTVLEGQRERTVREAQGSGIGRVERLVLGSDAQPKIERVLERLRGDVEACRGLSGVVEAE